MQLEPIAHVSSPFKKKFGIPRQSGLCPSLHSSVILERTPFNEQAIEGLEVCSHLWIVFGFHMNKKEVNSPKVRPPRLGGNNKLGVFSTRSPYRPNPIGLSACKLKEIKVSNKYISLKVEGLDCADETPVYDIKPYLTYVDSIPQASSIWDDLESPDVEVNYDAEALDFATQEKLSLRALTEILSQDPRPQFQNDPERKYGMEFKNYDVLFLVKENILTVKSIKKLK